MTASTTFASGKSGNPRGKPRGLRWYLEDLYRREPERAVAIVECLDDMAGARSARRARGVFDGLEHLVSKLPAANRKAFKPLMVKLEELVCALEDPRLRLAAIGEVFDRHDGRPRQVTQVTGELRGHIGLSVSVVPEVMRQRLEEIAAQVAAEEEAERPALQAPGSNGNGSTNGHAESPFGP